jgi:hypothetical protein
MTGFMETGIAEDVSWEGTIFSPILYLRPVIRAREDQGSGSTAG